jgi:hypothetical protein
VLRRILARVRTEGERKRKRKRGLQGGIISLERKETKSGG